MHRGVSWLRYFGSRWSWPARTRIVEASAFDPDSSFFGRDPTLVQPTRELEPRLALLREQLVAHRRNRDPRVDRNAVCMMILPCSMW
jgi:hypothetical protein